MAKAIIEVQTAQHSADRYSTDISDPNYTTFSKVQSEYENPFEGGLRELLMLVNDGSIQPTEVFTRLVIDGEVVI